MVCAIDAIVKEDCFQNHFLRVNRMADLALGLDLGPTSIGWALVDEDGGKIVGTGSRIFPEGVDRDNSGGEISKNQSRRLARQIRRQTRRRAKRKKQLRRCLVEAGLLPELALFPNQHRERVDWENEQFQQADPYTLRRRGLQEVLEPYELGRVLVHLNQRRGFLSNRKADRDRKDETSEMLQSISSLAEEMGDRTLGEFLDDERGDDPSKFHLTRIRGRHTRRRMLLDEFDAIWSAQQQHHGELLTDELRETVHGIIFFQRPLKPPSPSLVGRCELIPRLARCPRADRRAQKIRLFQEVNNLRVIDLSERSERALTVDERTTLIEYLMTGASRTFVQIRKKLFDLPDSIRLNLEQGGRKKLDGMPVDAAIANKNLVGKDWHKCDDSLKDRIIGAIIDDDEPRLGYLLDEAGLGTEWTIPLLEDLHLPEGYSSYSLNAIKKLLPHVEAGLPLTSREDGTPCAYREAGFLLPWDRAIDEQKFLPAPPRLTNPLVSTALFEVRKVVNAILRELVYREGHTLARIHIELAREIRGTAKQRAKRSAENHERGQIRDAIAAKLVEQGYKPTRDAVDRYILWQEQDEVCVYSGQAIGITQLLAGEVDVDHVLPFSRSLDNSLMNKVVCFRSENSQGVNPDAKGDRTPHEWLAESNPEKYEEVLQRARGLWYPKLKRFYRENVTLDDFFARQFVDTTYITTQVRQYVECLGAEIVCSKGQHTAALRHQWGLETILRELEDSPAWIAAMDLGPGEKNRLDHRHHAVDAIVIAFNDRSRLQQLARARRTGEQRMIRGVVEAPWDGFRQSVTKAVAEINVSHKAIRKISGSLHEETLYGKTDDEDVAVFRKPLEALSLSEVERIRDEVVRRKVTERLGEFDLEPGRGKGGKIPVKVWSEPLWMNEAKGIRISRVRIMKKERTIRPIRSGSEMVKPGNTHHVVLFDTSTPSKEQWDAVFVTMLEAVKRIKEGRPIVSHDHPGSPNAKFIMSLSRGEMVMLTIDDTPTLYRYETAATTTKQMYFRQDVVGTKDLALSKKPNTLRGLNPQKVVVDAIGRIRTAGD